MLSVMLLHGTIPFDLVPFFQMLVGGQSNPYQVWPSYHTVVVLVIIGLENCDNIWPSALWNEWIVPYLVTIRHIQGNLSH